MGEIFVWILRVASLTPRILEEILVGGLRRGGEPDGVDPSRLGILDEDLLLRRGGIGGKPGKGLVDRGEAVGTVLYGRPVLHQAIRDPLLRE